MEDVKFVVSPKRYTEETQVFSVRMPRDMIRELDNYDQTTSQVTQLNSEKTEASDKLNELRTERNSLGLFAGKEKKRLDTEIIDMVETIRQIEHKLTASGAYGGWWLRSTRGASINADCILGGLIFKLPVDCHAFAVRPALWIDLTAGN